MTLLSGDRALLEAFREGNPDALKAVLRHYAPVVAQSVRRGVRLMRGSEVFQFKGPSSELEVERLVEETFSRAFGDNARRSYDGVTPFAAYVCRIARNVMITEAQVAKRTPQPTLDGELPDLVSLTPSPEEAAQHTQLQELVAAFLAERPDGERTIYDARFKRGESQLEAAARLGWNRISVRRTEEKLKQAFLRFLWRRKVVSPPGTGKGVDP